VWTLPDIENAIQKQSRSNTEQPGAPTIRNLMFAPQLTKAETQPGLQSYQGQSDSLGITENAWKADWKFNRRP